MASLVVPGLLEAGSLTSCIDMQGAIDQLHELQLLLMTAYTAPRPQTRLTSGGSGAYMLYQLLDGCPQCPKMGRLRFRVHQDHVLDIVDSRQDWFPVWCCTQAVCLLGHL